jgi:hypothetical protein
MIPCVTCLESKFDRETLIDKKIPEILQRCNYSDSLLKNDLQIMDAISGCYEV